jgi:hypothetical protein
MAAECPACRPHWQHRQPCGARLTYSWGIRWLAKLMGVYDATCGCTYWDARWETAREREG